MKRIQKACLTQTVVFSNHNGETTAYARKLIEEEYEKYIKKLDVSSRKSSSERQSSESWNECETRRQNRYPVWK